MSRRIVSHKARSVDREELAVLICYEEGHSKQDIKKELPYSLDHEVLIQYGNVYEFKPKKA